MMILLGIGVLLVGGCTEQRPAPIAEFSYEPQEVREAQEVTFDASASRAPGGEILAYAWKFGDGTTADGSAPTHTYDQPGTYVVELTVVDDLNVEATVSRDIEVQAAPVDAPLAVFTAAPREGTSPLTVTFDADGSQGDIVAYAWTFGDGETATGVSVSHTYNEPGTYTARLTVEAGDGQTDTTTRRITVRQPATDGPLAAAFTVDPNPAEVGETVTFDASDSTGDITAYSWAFGDGSTAVGKTVQHTYTDAGVHEAQLTVEDSGGATDSAEKSVYVHPALPPPPG